MAFSPAHISNNILKRSFKDSVEVSPMKLQKLLYFVASEYSKEKHKPLLSEPLRAWQYGPVVRSVYDEFRSFGASPIRNFAKDATGKAYRIDERKNPALAKALDRVWKNASDLSAVQLSRITHLPASAWSKAYGHDELIDDADLEADTTYVDRLNLARRT